MGVDFPDYQKVSLTNIKLQALAEMTMRPKYGKAHKKAGGQALASGVHGELFTILSKGIIYGGYIKIDSEATQGNSYIRIRIDGTPLSTEILSDMMKYNLVSIIADVTYILKYDDTNFVYAFGFMSGITFEASLNVVFYNEGAETASVYGYLVYALI